MPFAVIVYTGREPEQSVGPLAAEQDAADWCAERGIEVDFPGVRGDDRRRGYILPFTPRS